MGRYYCDYCDAYLTHDSPSVRKTHCSGRKHKDNVRIYYQKWMEEQAKKLLETAQKGRPVGMPPGFGPPPGFGMPPGGLPPGFRPGMYPGGPPPMHPGMRPPPGMPYPPFPQGQPMMPPGMQYGQR